MVQRPYIIEGLPTCLGMKKELQKEQGDSGPVLAGIPSALSKYACFSRDLASSASEPRL